MFWGAYALLYLQRSEDGTSLPKRIGVA